MGGHLVYKSRDFLKESGLSELLEICQRTAFLDSEEAVRRVTIREWRQRFGKHWG
jgi:hypothetical protein